MKTLTEVLVAFDPHSKEKTIEEQFKEIAEVVFYGGFFSVNDGETEIYPVDIEFYLYSEREDDDEYLKDANMMHKLKNKEIDYFPKTGCFYPHRYGVDVGFEDKLNRFRASFFIRAYKYAPSDVKPVDSPPILCEDLFGYSSFAENGLRIVWENVPSGEVVNYGQDCRINLKDGKGNPDKKPWRFYKK